MIHEIKMPAAGQTTNTATISKIYVSIGDAVKRGDVLADAETDKAVLPVESYATGVVLDILVKDYDEVTAGTVLMAIGNAGETYRRAGAETAVEQPESRREEEDEYLPIVKRTESAEPAVITSCSPESRPAYQAMPGAKKLAKEKQIDLSAVVPANGSYIKKADVLEFCPAKTCTADAPEYTVMPMTRFRAITGKRMLESVRNIPAWRCTVSVNMRACTSMRDLYADKKGIKLSYNDVLAKAISIAVQKFPHVNARFEDDEFRVYKHTDIGLAVASDDALVVPVVKAVETKTLCQIHADYQEMIARARENKLSPADMGCGSITISNLGMFGVKQFSAIVNPPESCILAVGSIETEPVWNGTEFVPEPMMEITGSFDHRMIDGMYGAQFLREVKILLENPVLML